MEELKSQYYTVRLIEDERNYYFKRVEYPFRVFFTLEKSNVCNFIPVSLPTAPPWQSIHRLRLDKGKEGVCRAFLDDTLIWATPGKEVIKTHIEALIARWPVNPHLEEDIEKLPRLYRFGLKVLLYLRPYSLKARQHLSVCVWLNRIAARVFNRYNGLVTDERGGWGHSDDAIFYIETVLDGDASPKLGKYEIPIEAYLEPLGGVCREDLPSNERQTLKYLLEYIIRINRAVYEVQNGRGEMTAIGRQQSLNPQHFPNPTPEEEQKMLQTFSI